MKRIAAGLLAVALGIAVAGCSSSGSSTSGASSSAAGSPSRSAAGSTPSARPAVCDSVDALRASVQRLTDVNLSESGIGVFPDAWQAVQANLRQVVDDATAQYAALVDTVKVDADAVSSAGDAARANPTAASLSVLRNAIHRLADDVGHLVDETSPEC